MDPERWRQIDELLGQALEAPADQRAVLLDAACGSDQALRSHVERLLSAYDRAQRFLTAPAPEGTSQSTRELIDPLIGRTVGAYVITSRLGCIGSSIRSHTMYPERWR
jgi:hypothetical protein